MVTDNIIGFYFPPGSGGKFIINCLGLGTNAILQDETLAKQQLVGELDKLSELLSRLANETVDWNDLGLGDRNLYGCTSLNNTDTIIIRDTVKQVLSRGWYTFLVMHDINSIKTVQSVLPNIRIIQMENGKYFIDRFREDLYEDPQTLDTYWNGIKGPDWPVDPPRSIQEVNALPESIINELNNDFGGEIFDSIDYFSDIIFTWNAKWIKSKNEFLTHIEDLYDVVGITGFNKDALLTYYTAYIKKLEEIKNGSTTNTA